MQRFTPSMHAKSPPISIITEHINFIFPPSSLHSRLSTGSEKLQQVKVSEAHHSSNTRNYSKLRELHKAIFALLQNPTLFFLNLAGASEGLIIAGFAAFLPKQIENQFSVTAIVSALIMGIITVPAGGGGIQYTSYHSGNVNQL